MSTPPPNFCSSCGGTLRDQSTGADERLRRVCVQCGTVAYCNPNVLVNTIVARGDRVLLCRRAEPPAAGRWATPGGFMEAGETLEEAAARETFEETGVRIASAELRLHAVVSLPHINQVYVGFLAKLADDVRIECGPECLDARFFDEIELPWLELAYPDFGVYLRDYFGELRSGAHPIHVGTLDAIDGMSRAYRIAGVDESRWPRPTTFSSD